MTAVRAVDWEHEPDVVDMIAELTRPHAHREHYSVKVGPTVWGRHHLTKVPSLLAQLEHAAPSGDGQDRSSSGYSSRPAARLEAVDTFILIDKEASAWLREHGEDDPGSTTACVVRLGGLMPSMGHCSRDRGRDCCQWHAAEHAVRRWWTQARIVAGWDSAAWRPDATCPMCGQRGGLRIRLSAKVGLCVDCRETWTPETIGDLAFHIRLETFTTRAAGQRSEPCWCPWPTPVERLDQLCPRCGSARCHRAVMANLTKATKRAS